MGRENENEKLKRAQETIDEIFSAGGYIVASVIKKTDELEAKHLMWMTVSLLLLAIVMSALVFSNPSEISSPLTAFFVIGFLAGSTVAYAMATLFERARIKALNSLTERLKREAKLTDKELEEIEKEIEKHVKAR